MKLTKEERRAEVEAEIKTLPNFPTRLDTKACEPYSIECGADAWLQFEDFDPPEYQVLNGKCVVIVSKIGDNRETDEDDPLDPSKQLIVHHSKLRRP